MNSKTPFKLGVGICGLGTVGGGTLKLLSNNRDEIRRRVGADIEVVHVVTRTPKPALTDAVARSGSDLRELVDDPAVDVVVETIGGTDSALQLVKLALGAGKHVVTANKALIAEHGNELFALAEEQGVVLAFESSVAGGIPVIKALREGLAANGIDWLAGIINGTGNFILSEMAAHQRPFQDVLIEAQELGYAEADPTFDVDGTDAAHKLTIMAAIAFGIPLQFDKIYTEGISHITPEDIAYARELGYVIKHLGIARHSADGIELRVHPTLVDASLLLADVDGVGNAIQVHGNAVGSTLYNGPGAGAEATASSVVADLIDLARQKLAGIERPLLPALGYREPHDDLKILAIEDIESEYYLRISVQDRVGAMAHITDVLRQHDISIEAVIQKEPRNKPVPIVLLTHRALESRLNEAIAALEALDEVNGSITRIRLETFDAQSG